MSAGVCDPALQTLEVEAWYAVKVARWIERCGGVAVWGSLDLSDPSRTWITPARLTDGSPSQGPHWSAPKVPDRVVTNSDEVEIVTRREVRRFRVGIRRGYGLRWELTDASSRRLRAALAEAGPGAVHTFDGGNAIILAEASRVPLRQWLREHPNAGT